MLQVQRFNNTHVALYFIFEIIDSLVPVTFICLTLQAAFKAPPPVYKRYVNTHFSRSSKEIQNTPSVSPCNIICSLAAEFIFFHIGDLSDQSPFQENLPHGFLSRNNL